MGQGASLSEVVVSAGDWPQPGPSWSSGVSDVGPIDLMLLEATMGAFLYTPFQVNQTLAVVSQDGQSVMFLARAPMGLRSRSKLRFFP